LESLVKNFPTIKRARFWMTFDRNIWTHLRVIQILAWPVLTKWNSTDKKLCRFSFKSRITQSRRFRRKLQRLDFYWMPHSWYKRRQRKTYYIFNNCSHEAAYKETGTQGVSYTTGVPAMIGAHDVFWQGKWKKPGVFNVEEFDPDPFMEQLNKQGLPWHELIEC
jgi:saccharopine dehydrogenase (NAD+, L-lysine-forming)